MEAVLEALAIQMSILKLPYALNTYRGNENPCWVGEYYGGTDGDECGSLVHAPILSCFALKAEKELFSQVEKVRRRFQLGCLYEASDGTRVSMWLESIRNIPQDDKKLCKTEIALNILTLERR